MEETERTAKRQNKLKLKQEENQVRESTPNSDTQTNQAQEMMFSWGAGTEGQLGTGKLQDELTPLNTTTTLLHSLSSSSYGSISSLSCGGAHVIALTTSGQVLSWGRGASGQLGHGEVVSNCVYPKLVESLGKLKVSHVSAGWNHSGFVSDSGCLFTCGDGSFGQLGHGDYQSCSSPTEVSFFSGKHVEQIACGMRHSLVLLKGNDGHQVYGFGSGKRGQLGISTDKIKSSSLPKPCLGFESAEVVSIIANGDRSAALSGNGQLFTWGRGFSRRSDYSTPQLLSSTLIIKQAALGWNHALLLTSEREVFMLGGNHHGALSEPQRTAAVQDSLEYDVEQTLSKIPGLDGKKVVHIAAGAEHSAILSENGEVLTWGWGEHGQLGLGNTSDQMFPQPVNLAGTPVNELQMSRLFCGSGFTIALKTQSDL